MNHVCFLALLLVGNRVTGFQAWMMTSPRRTFSLFWHLPSPRFAAVDAAATTTADVTEYETNLDPILQRSLLLLPPPTTEESSADEEKGNVRFLLESNGGVRVWRNCLINGRLPDAQHDFDKQTMLWPPHPLFDKVCQAMVQLKLPRLVLRHAEIVETVLSTLVSMVLQFRQAQQKYERSTTLKHESTDKTDSEEFPSTINDTDQSALTNESLDGQELEILAEELVQDVLLEEWSEFVSGVSSLDRLFGANHKLLLNQDQNAGFGLHDGVWQHSGWKRLEQIQQDQLASIPELKRLMKDIGRRPSNENQNSVSRFVPRQHDPNGSLGAQFDPFRPESVSGLTLSGSLTEMLPSEAVLLKGSPPLRRLFLAKKAEAKLLSYERAGWFDTESVPKRDRRLLKNMPSAPGGPIIVCLDTSWSMSGVRETLSKAVVVACVSAAQKQKRDCIVVAFSSVSGVTETGLLTPDAEGVRRLLDFLCYSFGGGTDITGALNHAIETLQRDEEMAAADLLLITDGEIPDPPVSDQVLQRLDRLICRNGMHIHGLLIGKKESLPLSKLCTNTYDFLFGYENQFLSGIGSSPGSALAATRNASKRLALQRRTRFYPTTFNSRWQNMGCRHLAGFGRLQAASNGASDSVFLGRRRGGRRGRYDDEDDDELWDDVFSDSVTDYGTGPDEMLTSARKPVQSEPDDFTRRFKVHQESLNAKIGETLGSRKSRLDEILQQEWKESRTSYSAELRLAVQKMSENLVEREEESRIVVLGLISGENVLLLGKPGTAKSQLGRRLSRICGGTFFQRLLTRFTTPEEIFGPLSLRALENDEYRRCTEGFLPQASVAFLDEIFKANSAILNTLLTILNERQFDNGGRREHCAIRCVVGASNEMPESDELNALYDRFLLRKEVLSVSDEGMMQILKMSSLGSSACDLDDSVAIDGSCGVVFLEGLDQVISGLLAGANNVLMTDDTCVLFKDLRNFLIEDLGVEVSDRRLIKAARLLKICAASSGRRRVDALDCLLLQHVVWDLPEQRAEIRDWLWEHMTPGQGSMAQYRFLLDSLRSQAKAIIRKTSGDVNGSMGALPSDLKLVHTLAKEVNAVTNLLEERVEAIARHAEVLHRATEHLWLGPDEAKAAQQFLLPKAEAVLDELSGTLEYALGLELLLTKDSPFPNEFRLPLLETLSQGGKEVAINFTEAELNMGMKEAKSKYDAEMFRKWKRARKQITS